MFNFDLPVPTHATSVVIPTSYYPNHLRNAQYDWGYETVGTGMSYLVLACHNDEKVPQMNANGRTLYTARYARLAQKTPTTC
jgi:hypothetical protein